MTLPRRLALISPFALAACGTKPDTTATINRVLALIGKEGIGIIGAIAILSASRPELLPRDMAAQITDSLSAAKGALVALRDGLPDAMKPGDVWTKVDGVLNMVQIALAALPVIPDAKVRRYVEDAQAILLAARTIVEGARG